MHVDVLVIGGGAAGVAAAACAAQEGASVVLVRRGLGATALSAGAVDLAPDLYARPGEVVLAAAGLAQRTTVVDHIDRVLAHRPLHPYSVLGLRAAQVAAAANWLHGSLEEGILAWRGEDRPPFLLPDGRGDARAADMCPFSAAGGDLKGLRGTRVAVADFGQALSGWDAEQLARCMEFLIGEGIEVAPVPIALPTIGSPGRPVTTLDLAMWVDRDDGHALALAAAHAVSGRGWSHLMLPPALGVERTRAALVRVGNATGTIPFEVLPSGVPSVPGMRLQRALDRFAETSGVSLRSGLCQGFETDQGRIRKVHVTEADADNTGFEPKAVVLCTGRYVGGGITWDRRPSEVVFGLPVRVGAEFPEEAAPSRFMKGPARSRQAVFEAGVAVGDDLRPLGPGGQVAYGNLFAAGAVLAGQDDGAERGGTGMALVTGWIAGRTAARSAAR